MEILRVCVDADEINAADLRVDHVIYCIDSRATDSDNANPGKCFYVWLYLFHNAGFFLLIVKIYIVPQGKPRSIIMELASLVLVPGRPPPPAACFVLPSS